MRDFNKIKIDTHKFLTRTEEYFYITQWQKCKCYNSRNALIKYNMRYVAKIAYSLRGKYSHVPVADLMQYGFVGLINGINRFEISSGNRLITYAINWIRQSIQCGVEELESVIRAPRNVHEQIRKKVKDKKDLDHEEQVTMDNCRGTKKIDEEIGNDDKKMSLADKYAFAIHDPDKLHDNQLYIDNRNKMINSIVNDLPDDEKFVIKGLFGMEDGESKTLRDVGTSMNLSHEMARKKRNEVLKKLSHRFVKEDITHR